MWPSGGKQISALGDPISLSQLSRADQTCGLQTFVFCNYTAVIHRMLHGVSSLTPHVKNTSCCFDLSGKTATKKHLRDYFIHEGFHL